MVVIPTYNEADNIENVVAEVLGLKVEGLEILVVDDNSPDGTGQIADKLVENYPNLVSVLHRSGKLGFASAYTDGYQYALSKGADLIVGMDADLSHSPSYLLTFLEKIKDYDVVVGSRYVKGGGYEGSYSKFRLFLSWAGATFARTVLGLPVKDATSGFICYRRKALESIDFKKIKSQGYSFLFEMKYACHRNGFKLTEVPIIFPNRILGKSKMTPIIAIEAALRVWQIKWRY